MKLNIPFESLLNTNTTIEHVATQQYINELLILFAQKQKDYNLDVENPLFTPDLLHKSQTIWHGLLNTYAEKIKYAHGDQTSQQRAEVIIAKIQECCQAVAFSSGADNKESKPITTATHWQEHRLRLEQQLLMEDSALTKSFHQTLTAIAQKGTKDHIPPKCVLICYAWPDVSVRRTFQLPTISAPKLNPSSISINRVNPLHITVFPGGGSEARAR